MKAGRHFVYRCLNGAGEIVYVGCSHDVAKRWKQHGKTGVASATERMRITVHPTRVAALAVERAEIAMHEPLLNRQIYVMSPETWSRGKLLARLRAELSNRHGLPFTGDSNSAITTIRRVYRHRFGADPLDELS
ncbi:GIY-YIG nuclease family protein [Brachybacterium sp. AOP3-A1-3]|uniref:GIY-YIG nuclease family protein n=1 Tax=Brachybacterium sp. AOP3-A1-3 TaxID=3457699 RepID=UPI004033192C